MASTPKDADDLLARGNLVEWLRHEMSERKQTPSQCAKMLGISRQRVHQYLKGERMATVDLLVRMHKAFKVPYDLLLEMTPKQAAQYGLIRTPAK